MSAVIAVFQKKLEIIPLNTRAELADVCAAWDYAEWGCHMPLSSLQETRENFRALAQNSGHPVVWIALQDGKPVGMVTLTDEDHPDCLHLFPWLSALYVHPKYRGQGIGYKLCQHLIAEAGKDDGEAIYLYTATAESLYSRLGWQPIGTVQGPTGLDETLMKLHMHSASMQGKEF